MIEVRYRNLAVYLLQVAAMLLLLWVILGSVVFHFRHPWATETECFLNLHNAMLFRRIPYGEMRPRNPAEDDR